MDKNKIIGRKCERVVIYGDKIDRYFGMVVSVKCVINGVMYDASIQYEDFDFVVHVTFKEFNCEQDIIDASFYNGLIINNIIHA